MNFLRCFFCSILLLALTNQVNAASLPKGREQEPMAPIVNPGDYVWKPEASPSGPVVIVVSLALQKLYVYRNGVRIGRSTISSGKPGHRTPSGVFTILEKRVKHTSSIYSGASMPYMERLTWGGVALHAGSLPGYPAAHGCVRMPLDFARQLYTVTSRGTTVIVTDQESSSGGTREPGLLFAPTPDVIAPDGIVVWSPERAPTGPLSIIISSADGLIYVYRNGVEIGRGPVSGLSGVRGSYVYSALEKVDEKGRHDWQSTVSVGGRAPNIKKLAGKISVDGTFLANIRSLIRPGTTLILTDTEVNGKSRSASRFDILIAAKTP